MSWEGILSQFGCMSEYPVSAQVGGGVGGEWGFTLSGASHYAV